MKVKMGTGQSTYFLIDVDKNYWDWVGNDSYSVSLFIKEIDPRKQAGYYLVCLSSNEIDIKRVDIWMGEYMREVMIDSIKEELETASLDDVERALRFLRKLKCVIAGD